MDASESQLEGEVVPARSGGVVRYRVWPPVRHPARTTLAGIFVSLATAATYLFVGRSLLWSGLVFVGLSLMLGFLFFPTDITLDGYQLHIRRFGAPLSYDLRDFRRLEVARKPYGRVELSTRASMTPLDGVDAVTVPLPHQAAEADGVLVHLRRWVARRPTGRWEIDEDHAPEDTVV